LSLFYTSLYLLPLPILILSHIRMLDCQAPDVQIIADTHDHIHHKAPVYAYSETQAREHEADLVSPVAQNTRPQSEPLPEQSVGDGEREREDEDVLVGKGGFGQVCRDDLTDRVCVDEADEDDERDQVGVQDLRVKGQVGGDGGPGCEERDQAQESGVGLLAALAAGIEDVENAGRLGQR